MRAATSKAWPIWTAARGQTLGIVGLEEMASMVYSKGKNPRALKKSKALLFFFVFALAVNSIQKNGAWRRAV
jgi:hypothetical protein